MTTLAGAGYRRTGGRAAAAGRLTFTLLVLVALALTGLLIKRLMATRGARIAAGRSRRPRLRHRAAPTSNRARRPPLVGSFRKTAHGTRSVRFAKPPRRLKPRQNSRRFKRG